MKRVDDGGWLSQNLVLKVGSAIVLVEISGVNITEFVRLNDWTIQISAEPINPVKAIIADRWYERRLMFLHFLEQQEFTLKSQRLNFFFFPPSD
jgi:hypothetical protein